ncbi:MAG: hypothetical protein CM1200mP25_1450 [Acidobacteriota bacterium]|nr:MAG: hypothetical protein CM1200mP25_1450 [Acidobacteriota bacterium]
MLRVQSPSLTPFPTTTTIDRPLTIRTKAHHRIRYLFSLLVLVLLTSEIAVNPSQRTSTARIQTPNGSAGYNHPSVNTRPYVVLISFDGFRPDYLGDTTRHTSTIFQPQASVQMPW